VFFGRIGESKGCGIIPMLARSFPDLTFVLCGQGDATPYLTEPNIEYHAPISGADRAAYLAHAALAIFPSRFVEPFCGAAVEAMLVGTPVLTSSFGAFTETVIEGTTGYRCDDEIDFVRKLPLALALRRSLVAFSARQRFDMYHVGARYAALFHKIGEKNARRRTAAQFSHR
jgi:glycosyltransferase involved in cell wall biosynthesis